MWHGAAAGARTTPHAKAEFHATRVSPGRGRTGLQELLAEGVISRADEIGARVHGTTVSTNTVIERNASSDVALLVTEGMRDILNIQRLQPTRRWTCSIAGRCR